MHPVIPEADTTRDAKNAKNAGARREGRLITK
jgi:hypothetical protein